MAFISKHKTKPGITKAQAYSKGVFTITTDLRAVVECYGLSRTIELATILDAQLKKDRADKAKLARKTKVIKSEPTIVLQSEITVSKQLTDSVKASLAAMRRTAKHAQAVSNKPRRVAA